METHIQKNEKGKIFQTTQLLQELMIICIVCKSVDYFLD